MYLDKQIKITEFKFKIYLPSNLRSDNILAFGELVIINEIGDTIFRIRGFTIKERVFYNNSVTVCDFPAYRGGRGYVKSFITEDREILDSIRNGFLDVYFEETKDLKKPAANNDDEINPNDIPF